MNKPKVAIIMGSDSDFNTMTPCIKFLKKYDIEVDVNVISAHRTPCAAEKFASGARNAGIELIIAAAGKAAHLPGVLAAFRTLPVIGVPIKASTLDGLDALLSIVQMPKGIPVATVAIDGADNAAILAVQILALKYPYLADKLVEFKENMAREVEEKNKSIKEQAEKI